jgi:hypothetical protein
MHSEGGEEMVRNLMLAGAALLFSAPVWGQAYVSGGVSIVFGRPAPVYYYPQPVVPMYVEPMPVPYPMMVMAPGYRIPSRHWKKMRRGYAPAYYYGDRYDRHDRHNGRRRR